MKKLMVLLAGVGLSLVLIAGCFTNSLAEEKVLIPEKWIISGDTLPVPSLQQRVERNFKYVKPGPAKPLKVTGEFLVGGAGALLLGTGGMLTGYALAQDESASNFLYDGRGGYGVIIGYLVTSTLGSALGVYLIGNIGEDHGSFTTTLGGSAAGTLAGIGLTYLFYRSKEYNESEVPGFFLLTAVQAAGATVGFNLSRKKKVGVSSGTLLNVNEGKLSLAFPQVNLSTDSKSSSSYKVNLFQAKF